MVSSVTSLVCTWHLVHHRAQFLSENSTDHTLCSQVHLLIILLDFHWQRALEHVEEIMTMIEICRALWFLIFLISLFAGTNPIIHINLTRTIQLSTSLVYYWLWIRRQLSYISSAIQFDWLCLYNVFLLLFACDVTRWQSYLPPDTCTPSWGWDLRCFYLVACRPYLADRYVSYGNYFL